MIAMASDDVFSLTVIVPTAAEPSVSFCRKSNVGVKTTGVVPVSDRVSLVAWPLVL